MHVSLDEGNSFHSQWLRQEAGCGQVPTAVLVGQASHLVHTVRDAMSGALAWESWAMDSMLNYS